MNRPPPRIVVVDDNESALFAKVQVLRRAGYDVLQASTGAAALAAVETHGPDVVLLDINLPDMTGFEVCRRVKSIGVTPPVQVLQMSSTAVADSDRVRGLSGGADAYLTEPVNPPVLLATIEALLRVRRAEQAAARALEGEQAARADAERANQLKDNFLATLSHELRTPLNAMVGWIWQIRHAPDDVAVLTRALSGLERSTQIQIRLINDLLDFSRIGHGKIELERTPVDLSALLENSVESLREGASVKELTLEVRTVPAWVLGDVARLQQILLNLVGNAIQFTPAGGSITVTLEVDGRHAVIRVKDTGEGIAQEFLPHVFDQFRQAEMGFRRRHGGLGLGLAIVRQLVALHGGTVAAASEGAGKGAEFTVRLPAQPEPRVKPVTTSTVERLLEGERVLVVDDEAETREWLRIVLESAGAIVTTAGSVPQALALLANGGTDLLVSDIGMPGQDGLDLIAAARQSGATIPAVALTAFSIAQEKERILGGGYDLHVAKPIEPAQFVQRLAALLKSRASAS
jgi:two-component system, sensor histidine kinase